jgi:hypothetical protein
VNMPDRDEAYLDALRSRLPSDDEKRRMRARLLALGALSAATVPAAASAQLGAANVATKLGLWSASKVVLALSVSAALAGAALLVPAAMTRKPEPARRTAHGMVQAMRDPAAVVIEQAPRVRVESAESALPEPRRAHARPRRASPAVVIAPSSPLDTLEAENALLGAAVSALHQGRVREANALLDQHEQRFPDGSLRDERERARRRLKDSKDAAD